MNKRHDLASAVTRRERGRDRVRLLTVTAGVASLATAGAVALNLPASTHTASSNGTAVTPAVTPSTGTGQSGDEGGSDDGGTFTVPGGTASQAPVQAPAHAISGGS